MSVSLSKSRKVSPEKPGAGGIFPANGKLALDMNAAAAAPSLMFE